MSSKKKTALTIIGTFIFATLCAIGLELATTEYRLGDFAYSSSPWKGPMRSGIKAQTNIFDKGDVTLDLYYGFYENGQDDFLGSYVQESSDKIVVALYVCDKKDMLSFDNYCEYKDYENIENHYFMKRISHEEIISGSYGYENRYMLGIVYDHKEILTIPEEFFNKDSGTLVIEFRSFIEPREEGGNYYSTNGTYIELDYEITNIGKVRIKNLESN